MFRINYQAPLNIIAFALSIHLVITPAWAVAASKKNAPLIPSLSMTEGKTHEYIEVPLNKTKIFKVNAPVSRISVSNPDMVGFVILSPTEIQINGKQIGSSSILIWTEKSGAEYINIDVSVHRDIITLGEKIKLIDPNVNIQAVPAEDAIILTGTASSKETSQYILDIAHAFFSEGSSSASPSTSPGGTSGTASSSGADPMTQALGASSGGAASGTASSPKIINMIHVPGEPLTKEDRVQAKLHEINANILLAVIPGRDGSDKAILTGKVRNGTEVAKAINLTSMFYGTPGIKVISGPGGVLVASDNQGNINSQTAFAPDDTTAPALMSNLDKNIQQGSILTDVSGNVVSMLVVTERPQVKCKIQILEVRKSVNFVSALNSYFNSNGIAGASYVGTTAGASAILPGNVLTAVTGANAAQLGIRWSEDVATFISGLLTNGKARVLAEPSITTISGERGTFLAGGEFPIPTSSVNGQINVTFKEFGIRLNVVPTVTDRGTIHMQVSPEVSSLDPSAGIILNSISIPGLRSRKSTAVVEMKEGCSFVLSGLYNEDMTKTIGKTPLLGQIPILGELFKSRSYQRNETELVIVIYPEIIRDMNDDVLQATKVTSSALPTSNTIIESTTITETTLTPPHDVFGMLAISSERPSKTVKSHTKSTAPLHAKGRPQRLIIN